jgi:putative phosphoesterase
MAKAALTIGVISDTHGLLRPEALAALAGADIIIHAGDVGSGNILDPLRGIAPVFAVRGNIDHGTPAASLPATAHVEANGLMIHVLHNIADLDFDPAAAGFAAVVFGHSHRPSVETRDGVLYLNPGSAGPRRFTLPVSVARLRLSGGTLEPEIVMLQMT